MLINGPRELALMAVSRRKQLKLSQAAVGDLVGLKQKTISAFENKPECVQLMTIFRILSALNLEMRVQDRQNTSKSTEQWNESW